MPRPDSDLVDSAIIPVAISDRGCENEPRQPVFRCWLLICRTVTPTSLGPMRRAESEEESADETHHRHCSG